MHLAPVLFHVRASPACLVSPIPVAYVPLDSSLLGAVLGPLALAPDDVPSGYARGDRGRSDALGPRAGVDRRESDWPTLTRNAEDVATAVAVHAQALKVGCASAETCSLDLVVEIASLRVVADRSNAVQGSKSVRANTRFSGTAHD